MFHLFISAVKFTGECCVAYIPAAPFPPAPLHPIRSQDKGDNDNKKPSNALKVASVAFGSTGGLLLHRSRISKGFSEVALDSILWREINLLKEFG